MAGDLAQQQGTGRGRQGSGLVQRPLAGEGCLNTCHGRMALGTFCRGDLGLELVGVMPGVMAAKYIGVERPPLCMSLGRFAAGVNGMACGPDVHKRFA